MKASSVFIPIISSMPFGEWTLILEVRTLTSFLRSFHTKKNPSVGGAEDAENASFGQCLRGKELLLELWQIT